MKNNHLFSLRNVSLTAFAVTTLLLSSCTIGYNDDWNFSSGVKNVQLESPKAEDVTFTMNVEGTAIKVEWPVVLGARGYEFSLYNIDDPENPVVVGEENRFIDGCSTECTVEEDTNYKVTIKALGNTNDNNKDAETATEVNYSTLVPSAGTIPSGSDIAQYFIDNPITSQDGEVAYDLEAGGEYTMSNIVDFGLQNVTIRGNKMNHSKVTFGKDARFVTQAGLKIKFIDFDCNAVEKGSSDAAFILLSPNPDESLKVASGEYVIKDPIAIQSCNINDINRHIIYDNSKKYAVENFNINNSVLKINQSNTLIYFKSGSLINFTAKESTIYSTVQAGNYFAQINGNRPNKITGYSNGSFNFYNCTVYNIAYNKDFVNWNRYRGQSIITINFSKTIFVDCGRGDMTNKIMGNANMSRQFDNNTYWYNGARSNDKYDTNTLTTDPGFANSAEGNFTVSGADQLEKRTGDPRWLPILPEE